MTIAAHPNEFYLRRISRLLKKRARYQYVSPSVQAIPGGYRIVSPCCSRNVDEAGGPIDIARIEWGNGMWTLYSRDHAGQTWRLQIQASRLDRLMDCLNEDSQRVFWK